MRNENSSESLISGAKCQFSIKFSMDDVTNSGPIQFAVAPVFHSYPQVQTLGRCLILCDDLICTLT